MRAAIRLDAIPDEILSPVLMQTFRTVHTDVTDGDAASLEKTSW